MDTQIVMIVGYLNLIIGINLLFQKESTLKFTWIYLFLMVGNICFSRYTLLFLLVVYGLQCYYISLSVANIFFAILLQNFFLNVIGLAFFLAFDVARYVGLFNLFFNSFIELIMVTVFFYLLRKINKKYSILDYLNDYTKKIKGITLFLTVLYFVLFAFHIHIESQTLDYLLTSIITLLYNLFYTFFFLFYVVYKRKVQLVELYLKDKQETNEYYAKLDEFRHDYLNYLSALEYSLQNKTNEESELLLNHLKRYSLDFIDDARHNPLKKINDAGVRGLFYKFAEQANTQMIPYQIQVLNPIGSIKIEYIDLLRLLSIALKNAVEHYAAKTDRYAIRIILNQTQDSFSFKISNPAMLKNSNLADLLKRGNSSKKHGGLGLYNFSKITESYRNATYQIRYIKSLELFELELAIFDEP